MDSWEITTEEVTSGKENSFNLKDYILVLPPLFIPVYKRFKEENLQLVKSLAKLQIPLFLYSSIDPDLAIPCRFINDDFDPEHINYMMPGDDQVHNLKLKQIDGFVIRQPFYLLLPKNENGIFTRIYMKLSNRKDMKYAL